LTADLEKATALFKNLAEQPVNNDNNVMGQLLYGLALRHGWGCEANMSKAVIYLKAAAENAANAEDDALAAGLSKGGKLKNELTLAIFELGNCFRNGWV
jgi:TPR repeat protein